LYFSYSHQKTDFLLNILGRLTFVTGGIAIYFLLTLSHNFPRPIFKFPNFVKYLMLGETIALSVVTLFTKFIDQDESYIDGSVITVYGSLYPWFIIHFVGLMLASLTILFVKYRKSTSFEKQQLKFLFAGLFLTTGFAVITNLFVPLLTGYYDIQRLGPIGTVFMVATISYAIIKHRLMDIRLIIVRSVTYILLITVLGIFYSGSTFAISSIISRQMGQTADLLLSTFFALIIALTFQPLRLFLEKITSNIFYKDRYDSQELLNTLSHTIATTLTLSDLTFKVLEVVTTQMKISRAFIVTTRNKKLYIIESHHKTKRIAISADEFEKFQSETNVVVFEEVPEGSTKEFMRQNEIAAILPLRTREHYIGLFLMGTKSSGDIYFDQDISVLEIIGPELAIALQNAQRFEEISDFNITLQEEVKRATGELRIANEKLKELDRLKDEFVSLASHELRTPMTAIKGHLWMVINKHKIPPATKEELDKAYASTERSIAMVSDMLDISRIEAGRLTLEPIELDLVKLGKEIASDLAPKIQEKKLTVTIPEGADFRIKADDAKTRQVIINILGNALKFTPEGGKITLGFKVKDNFVETSITDTGVGIKKEDLPKLFSKFGRLDNSLSSVSASPGTGLGLYISKKIIELSGGKIWAESEVGKGSTFIFSLPKAK